MMALFCHVRWTVMMGKILMLRTYSMHTNKTTQDNDCQCNECNLQTE